MALKERLDAAREDYRSLPAAPNPARHEGERGQRAGRLLAAAAVMALLVGGAVAWWGRSDGPATVEAGPATSDPSPTQVETSKDPDPPGAVATFSADVSLDPSGPYADGQNVTVSVPDGFASDLVNGTPEAARQCVVLEDGPGGPGEWCDPADRSVPGSATASSVDLRLSRVVFTPTGDRDCEEAGVTCRIVLTSAEQRDVASEVLRFDRGERDSSASLGVSAGDAPGTVVLRPEGVEPHPSWLELRAQDPERAEGFGPFRVSLCAFGPPDPPEDPWGENRWLEFPALNGSASVVPRPHCDQYDEIATLDPDDPTAPVEATVPTWFLGYGGWTDCRTDTCFIQISRSIVRGSVPGGGLLGGDEVIATALVPPELVDPEGGRPGLRIVTPGPHSAGQELTVEIGGLDADRTTSIGVCQAGDPWGCGYLGGALGPDEMGNGTHVIRLPEQFACLDRCYLELDSQGEGMPPLATAALAPD